MVRPLNAIGVHRVPKARDGESTRGSLTPSRKGVWGISPEKIFKFKMSVEAILRPFLLVKLGLLYRHYMTLYSNLFRTPTPNYEQLFRPVDRSYLLRLKLFKLPFFRQPYISGNTLDHLLHHNAAMSYW